MYTLPIYSKPGFVYVIQRGRHVMLNSDVRRVYTPAEAAEYIENHEV